MKRGLIVPLFAVAALARADEKASSLTLGQYLNEVVRGNLELQAQRYDLSIAEAQIEVARVFPDWSLSGGLGGYDLAHSGAPTTVAVSLGIPLEIAGKRGKRITVASEQAKVSEASLADALRTLRRDASGDFIDDIHARLVRDRKRLTLEGLNKLLAYNLEALRVGQVGEVAVLQSRVEVKKFEVELEAADATVLQANLQLALRMGRDGRQPLPGTPTANLSAPSRSFDLDKLLAEAEQHRPDLLAARRAVDAARAQLALARANRWTDLTVGLGYNHGFPGEPPNYPEASFDMVSVTLGVSLPLSRLFYQGDVSAAELSASKAESTALAVLHAAQIEIETALQRYAAAGDVVARYEKGILSDSEALLAADLYNYQRGGISQLEVIAVQRDLNAVYLAFDDALQERAKALVALEQAAAIWDIALE